MRIGIMIRTIDAIDGPGVYTINLLNNLLSIDNSNYYVLFYKTDKHFGRYSKFSNVKELLIKASSKLIWDQIMVPYYAWKENVDIIFHTKFSIPLLTSRPTVMCLRGSEWFIYPSYYKKTDIAYIKFFMPLYCKKAKRLISNSDTVKNDFIKYLGVDESKITTIYNAHNSEFKLINDEHILLDASKKYGLPQKFLLTVTRAFHDGMKDLYPGKNIDKIIEGYQLSGVSKSHKLVVVGYNIKEYLNIIGRQELSQDPNVIFTGYIDQKDLPFFYNLADCFVFPSFYESFTFPIIEAMACGCPIITSKQGACLEEAQDAALYVEDPKDEKQLATCIEKLVYDEKLKNELVTKGLRRAKDFNYKYTAEKTLNVFESFKNMKII